MGERTSTTATEPEQRSPAGQAVGATPRRAGGERGSAVLLVPVALALCVAMLLGVARLGDGAVRRARADGVADLVALAGAVDGPRAAEAVAAANGAELLGTSRVGEAVRVEVRVEGLAARAAARPTERPTLWGAPRPVGSRP